MSDTLQLGATRASFKPPKAFDWDFYHACRMQGGPWQLLGAWLDMLPAQRRVYAALDRLRVLRNVPTTVCEGCGCRKHCALDKEIHKAERRLRVAKADPDCIAYDELIETKRKAALVVRAAE